MNFELTTDVGSSILSDKNQPPNFTNSFFGRQVCRFKMDASGNFEAL